MRAPFRYDLELVIINVYYDIERVKNIVHKTIERQRINNNYYESIAKSFFEI